MSTGAAGVAARSDVHFPCSAAKDGFQRERGSEAREPRVCRMPGFVEMVRARSMRSSRACASKNESCARRGERETEARTALWLKDP